MGFNIKNNYGPNIEVNAGGKVTLVQDKNGLWHTADAEEAEYEEVTDETLRQDPENTCDNESSKFEPSIGNAVDNEVTLSTSRKKIFNQLLDLADKGDWVNGITSEHVKQMLQTVLGQGETSLSAKEAELSEVLWHLLENGRGDRVRVSWQNMVGYFDDKHLLKIKSAPALNVDFFGNKIGADNINKGRPSRGNMPAGFCDIIPLLDAYVPRVG